MVWGRIEAHAEGLRAEHGRIEVLADPPRNDPERRRVVAAVAQRLGIPAVPRAELTAVADGLGVVLPAVLQASSVTAMPDGSSPSCTTTCPSGAHTPLPPMPV